MALIRQADSHQHFRHAVVLNLGDLHQEGERITSAATARAKQAIGDAEAKRAKMLAGAAEEGRAAGLRDGLEQGMKQGIAAGMEKALNESKARLAELEKGWTVKLAAFEADRTQLLLDARQAVLGLAVRAAEMIVKRTIAHDATVIQDQLAAVIASIARPTRLRVRVCPDDEAIVRSALPSLMDRFRAAEHVEIVVDPSVSRGGCVAATAAGGSVDATIETQLERVVAGLLPRAAPSPSNGEVACSRPEGDSGDGASAAEGRS